MMHGTTNIKSIPTSHNQLGTSAKKFTNLYSSKRVVTQCLRITWDSNQQIQCTTYLRSENPPYIVVFHIIPRRKTGVFCVFKKWLISVITNYWLQESTIQLMMDYAKKKKKIQTRTKRVNRNLRTKWLTVDYLIHCIVNRYSVLKC